MRDETDDHASPIAGPRPEARGMPRWVKILLALVVVVVIALAVSKIAGVEHGPGMHGGSGDTPTNTGPPAGADGHVPPVQHAP